MEELIIAFAGELLSGALDIGGEILEAAGEMILGAGAVFLVYKAAEKITDMNLVENIRKAIRKKNEQLFKKALGTTLTAYIKEAKPNEMSLEVLTAECKELEKQEIRLESTEGVETSLKTGMKIKFSI
ncbi:MAG: hypothetical protein IJT73_01035 [Selenomonadaceae bacterium]|nr:hypothetical protein [Selenomonadaceae bacterium]